VVVALRSMSIMHTFGGVDFDSTSMVSLVAGSLVKVASFKSIPGPRTRTWT
jgi:hypothetical protein